MDQSGTIWNNLEQYVTICNIGIRWQINNRTIIANDGWHVPNGEDCWYECGDKSGKCDFCGTVGYCCSSSKDDLNAGCTTEMQTAIENSEFNSQTNTTGQHLCVAKYEGEILFYKFNLLKPSKCNVANIIIRYFTLCHYTILLTLKLFRG